MKLNRLLIYACLILTMSCTDDVEKSQAVKYYYLKNLDGSIVTRVEPELITPVYEDLTRLNRKTDAENLLHSYDKTTGSIIGYSANSINSKTANESGRISTVGRFDYGYHVQSYGWSYGSDDVVNSSPQYYEIGTTGLGKRLEAYYFIVNGVTIQYQSYVQDYAWQAWKYNGEISGTVGESKRIEAVKIGLVTGQGYVTYKSYLQDIGWESTWATQFQISGTTGQSRRLEAIRLMFYIY